MIKAMVTDREREILARIFAQFCDDIDQVNVFGSRATGAAEPGSDIDLVVYGNLSEKAEWRLWSNFDDSDLPISVDLVVYARIKNELLKEHIDKFGVPLFTRADLRKIEIPPRA